MERLSDDALLIIFKKVASSSAELLSSISGLPEIMKYLASYQEIMYHTSLVANLAQKNKLFYDTSLAVGMQRAAWCNTPFSQQCK